VLKYYEFINENDSKTYSGEWVAEHIRDITPYEEDVPNYFIDKYVLPNIFVLKTVNIEDILESDSDFAEYFNSGSTRYEEDEVNEQDLEYEVVIVNGEVMDGYNRMTVLYNSGIEEVEAYVNI